LCCKFSFLTPNVLTMLNLIGCTLGLFLSYAYYYNIENIRDYISRFWLNMFVGSMSWWGISMDSLDGMVAKKSKQVREGKKLLLT
jgi:phosphatidylglycerophosphate synthase